MLPAPARAGAEKDARPGAFRRLGNDLAADLRNLPTLESGILLGASSGLSAATHPRDARITESLARNEPLEDFLDAGQVLGSEVVLLPATLLTWGVGSWAGSARTTALGYDLFRAQVVVQTLTQGLKRSVDRTRPDGTRFSFPSGHTSTSFAMATVVQRRLGWRAGLPALAFATYVGVSRLAERRHYPSDVIFGAALGIVTGRAVTAPRTSAGLLWSARPSVFGWKMTPQILERGAGLTFTRRFGSHAAPKH